MVCSFQSIHVVHIPTSKSITLRNNGINSNSRLRLKRAALSQLLLLLKIDKLDHKDLRINIYTQTGDSHA